MEKQFRQKVLTEQLRHVGFPTLRGDNKYRLAPTLHISTSDNPCNVFAVVAPHPTLTTATTKKYILALRQRNYFDYLGGNVAHRIR